MHSYMHSCKHTYINSLKLTHIHAELNKYVHIWLFTYTHAHINTFWLTYMYEKSIFTCIKCKHTYIHACRAGNRRILSAKCETLLR